MISAMFVSLYSRCCDPSARIEKNRTLHRMAEMGVSITVLVVGILIDLHGISGFPLCGFIVTGVGGMWVVGNVIVIAIQYTSCQNPISKKKRVLTRKNKLRTDRTQKRGTNSANDSSPPGDSTPNRRSVSRPAVRDGRKALTPRNSENDEDSSTGLTEGDNAEDEGALSTTNQGETTDECSQVESEEKDSVPQINDFMAITLDNNSLGLWLRIKEAKIEIVNTLMNWRLRSKISAEYTEKLAKKIEADFDRIIDIPLGQQEKYQLVCRMVCAYQVFLGMGACETIEYCFVFVKSTFGMALQVLVHTKLGDYFLHRPLEVQGQTTPTAKWQIELQALMKILVDKMREKGAPTKDELKRLHFLKKALSKDGKSDLEDSFWLLK